jgi:PAS domain S-box-containing protein
MDNNKLKQIRKKVVLHTTLENLLEGFQIIDFDYRYLFINNAAAKQGRKTAKELLGHLMVEMYPGIETTQMFSVLKQSMQERIPRQMENEFIFEDDTKGWYHLSFEPVPEGVLIMSTDITETKKTEEKLINTNKELAFQNEEKEKRTNELIIANKELAYQITERKLAEEELKNSTRLLESVFSSSEDLILVVDKDLRVIMSNWKSPIYADVTEFPIGSHCYEAFIHRDTPCEPCHVFGVFNTGVPILVEYYNQHTKLFKEVNAYPIFDDNHKVKLVVEDVRDITERKHAEKLIQENEEKYHRIFDNIQDVYYETSIDGTINEVSPSIKILSKGQYHRDELIGKSMYNFYSDSNDRTALISKIKEQGTVSDFEITLKNKDGSQIPCSISSKICFDPQGRPEKIIGSMRDITEQKKTLQEIIIVNKELAFQNEEKEKRAAELIIANKELAFQNNEKDKRAAELIIANKELAYQNKEKEKRAIELTNAKENAEESDRLKSAFLTNMSHEIRTPMNGILGFTELLKEPNLTSDEQQDYIQIIQISGARMLNTINNIVDVSKIESGLIQVDIKETNINEKIEFTYKFFKPEVEIKGLQFLLTKKLPSNEAIIKTDNEKVYGILTNLVRNAIKFTYEGSIEFGYEKKGEYLEFFVKDTGIGIPKNQKELIFDRFRQGSESHNRGYEGSGLGLSISKSYVEMLDGKIWVESEEGKGSTFYFTIPYNSVMEERTEIENVVSEKDKEVEIKNLKILIVEDDEISYSLLTKMLQKISKEVLHAITGVEAVEACRNNPDLDFVLMDIRMPVMDGNEATRQIRQFNKDVIIIAQTAYGFSRDKEKAIEVGCNDFISKPINKTLLYELIKKHIKLY